MSRKNNKKNNDSGAGKWLLGIGAAVGGLAVGLLGTALFDSNEKSKQKEKVDNNQRRQIRDLQRQNQEQQQVIQHQQQQQQRQQAQVNFADDITNENLLCPISLELMTDPHFLTTCGHTFEKNNIVPWVQQKHTCPVDKSQCSVNDIKPNIVLKNYIEDLRQQQIKYSQK